MKAEQGKTYAQVLNGRCHWIFTAADLPEWNESQIQTVDVTGNIPEVGAAWNGSGFDPIAEPVKPVLTCTPWQIRKALVQTGDRAAVEAAIAQADQTTQDGWEYATEFRRDDPLVVAMGAALGKTDADMDNLFTLARSL